MKKGLGYKLLSLLLLVFLGLLLFTPLGFYIKVYANRLLSHNPTPVPERQQQVLKDYDFSLRDLNGEPFNLKETRGEVVLLNFWATWCPPCIAEMPDLEQLYLDYGRDVRFLFIARDREDRVEAFLTKNGYTIPVYYEQALVPKQLYYGGIPTTFILDKNGRIVVSKVGSASWNNNQTRDLLDSLLQK